MPKSVPVQSQLVLTLLTQELILVLVALHRPEYRIGSSKFIPFIVVPHRAIIHVLHSKVIIVVLLQRRNCTTIRLAVTQPDVAQMVHIIVHVVERLAIGDAHIPLGCWKILQYTFQILVASQVVRIAVHQLDARLMNNLFSDFLSQCVVNIRNKFISGINLEVDSLGQVQMVVGDLVDPLAVLLIPKSSFVNKIISSFNFFLQALYL